MTARLVGDVPRLTERVEDMLADVAAQAVVEYPLDDDFVYREALPYLRACARGARRGEFARWHGIPDAERDGLARVRAWVASYRSNWRRRHKLPAGEVDENALESRGRGARYTPELVARAAQMHADKWTYRQIARELGVGADSIMRAVNRLPRQYGGEATDV